MPQRSVSKKRKNIVADGHGMNVFVLEARAMPMERKNTSVFQNVDGGDLTKEFELARKPLIRKALKAKIEYLQKKRSTEHKKKSVGQNMKARRNMADTRNRPDFKD